MSPHHAHTLARHIDALMPRIAIALATAALCAILLPALAATFTQVPA